MKKVPLLAAIITLAAFAQPPGGPGGPGPMDGMQPPAAAAGAALSSIKAFLGLSDAQIASIQAAKTSALDANRTIMAEIQTKQTALNDLLAKGATDASAVGNAMLEIDALRKQAKANLDKARTQALSFLSADQKTKLKQLEDAEKLRVEIGEAHALLLLTPPATPSGMPGMRMMRLGGAQIF